VVWSFSGTARSQKNAGPPSLYGAARTLRNGVGVAAACRPMGDARTITTTPDSGAAYVKWRRAVDSGFLQSLCIASRRRR
jgi:hypothetical protein